MPVFKKLLFIKQTKRFAGAVSELMRDIFIFDKKLVTKQIFFSMLGPTIQAAALGLVLFLARDFGADGNYETIIIKPLGGMVVSTGIVLTFIIFFLCLSIFFLYESDRLIAYISANYANNRAGGFIATYPLISHRYKPAFYDSDRLVPADLVNKVKEYASVLFLSSRILLRIPTGILYAIYGLVFLLYLEPLLTLVLAIFILPLLFPLRRFTRDITYRQRMKHKIGSQTRKDLTSIISEIKYIPDISTDLTNQLLDKCNKSTLATSTKLTMMRRINIARSKAIANIALAIAVGISAFYFFVISKPAELSLANVVGFFIALRLASMGGKRATGPIARFAKCYNKTHAYLSERDYANTRRFKKNSELVIKALNLETSSQEEKTVEPGKPLAIISYGQLSVLNKYKVAVFEEKTGLMDRGDIASGTYIIPENPDINSNISWRMLINLPEEASQQDFISKAESLCRNINISSLCSNLDQPIKQKNNKLILSISQRVEILLLRFYFSNKPILVLPSEIVSTVNYDLIEKWISNLKDRFICIYYANDSVPPFVCHEDSGILVTSAGKILGIASTKYFDSTPDIINELIKYEERIIDNTISTSYGFMDDDEDEDD